MSTFKNSLRAFAFLSVIISTTLSVGGGTVYAQSSDDWRAWYEEYRRSSSDDGERSARTSRTSSRERYSSATQREINRLDDDPVEELPIPILFGLSLNQIYPDFGDPRGGGTREHEGQDFIAPRGAPIASPTEAVVTRTGNGSSSGIYVYTANPGGETFRYMHLDGIAEGIKSGTVLEPGHIIGFVGDTGNALGGVTHLHFEIRDREAIDPHPRLTREFTTKERVAGIEAYLEELDRDDAEEFAEEMVSMYRSHFIQARLGGMELPDEIEDQLGTATAVVAATSVVRDLTLGSQGSDVVVLQTALIALNTGSAATALSGAGATGYFGTMTQAALAEYQRAQGIAPAAGYYGPLTRAQMAVGG